jgi:hypothetical protein
MLALNRGKVRRVVCGVDWGFVHPGVIEVFALDGDDRMYRVWEVYQAGKTIDWWIERAQEIHDHFHVEAFACDPSEPAYITQFKAAGLPAIPAFNGIAPGIQAVAQRLVKQPDGRARLYFLREVRYGRDAAQVEKKLPTCLEEEMDGYVYPTANKAVRAKDEVPLDVNNDSMDALRYAVVYCDGVGMNRWTPATFLGEGRDMP